MMSETIVHSSNYDMQDEKDYLNHYNKFLQNRDFEKLF